MELELTSKLAYQSFLAEKKDARHYREIINTLRNFPYLSSWGISQNSTLSYHQVGRRLKELKERNVIKVVCQSKDRDGAIRNQYTLI